MTVYTSVALAIAVAETKAEAEADVVEAVFVNTFIMIG